MDPITILLGIGSKVIDKIWPDPAQRDAAKLELLKMQQSGELAQLSAETNLMIEQIKVNQGQAQNPSLFVSGARPFIMWVCGFGCAWNWIGLPIAKFGCALAGIDLTISQADLSEMMPLLLGMLGLSGYRTIEKLNGVAAK
jgi:hypothetical protein